MENKHTEQYDYKNYLQRCPNCDGPLKTTDYDCPHCGINLVGYNEENNRADNLTKYADSFDELAERNDKLNDKIKKENAKVIASEKRQQKVEKTIFKIVGVVALCVAAVVMAVNITNEISDSLKSKSYDEVAEHLINFNEPDMIVDELNVSDWDIEKEDSYLNDWHVLTAQEGYDSKTSTTYIREIFESKNGDGKYSVVRVLSSDVAHIPEFDVSWGEVDFIGEYRYMYFKDEFVGVERGTGANGYILSEFVEDKNNFVVRVPSLKIGDTEIHLYWIGQSHDSTRDHKIVGVIELSDSMLHVSELSTSVSSSVETILESPEKYFHIQIEREDLENAG